MRSSPLHALETGSSLPCASCPLAPPHSLDASSPAPTRPRFRACRTVRRSLPETSGLNPQTNRPSTSTLARRTRTLPSSGSEIWTVRPANRRRTDCRAGAPPKTSLACTSGPFRRVAPGIFPCRKAAWHGRPPSGPPQAREPSGWGLLACWPCRGSGLARPLVAEMPQAGMCSSTASCLRSGCASSTWRTRASRGPRSAASAGMRYSTYARKRSRCSRVAM